MSDDYDQNQTRCTMELHHRAAQKLLDSYPRKMTKEENRLAVDLINAWTQAPPDDRYAYLEGCKIWFEHGSLPPVVADGIWIVRAVRELGQPVIVNIEQAAQGQTFGMSSQQPVVGRGASQVTNAMISDRAASIIWDTQHGLPRDPGAPEWFPPNSGRMGVLTALLSSINRWGHKAPDVWTPPAMRIRGIPTTPRKLTRVFLDHTLPPGEEGLKPLLRFKQAIDTACRYAKRAPEDDIIPLDPIPASAMVWACYAEHPTKPLFPPPIGEWLRAAVHDQMFDNEDDTPTKLLLRIRDEQGTLRTRRNGQGSKQHHRFYQTIAVQIVEAWITTKKDLRLKRWKDTLREHYVNTPPPPAGFR